ncbi:TlpA family protein disulfide reductase [Paenibacillus eucommiae]|uniref:Methylamine dehydrogenase accessory protein MauD n=1 Tax=Paenibacillus eucommiae TaxID=1355755 RepID=A0ABS4J2P9_9BACL|nr:thioredoxin-like domain-containing protein [Paenibacillus eucommiae]MBP1993580.1 methylamine dehydrogenase accessory protein MauD [Paenibacillus eucommiae]
MNVTELFLISYVFLWIFMIVCSIILMFFIREKITVMKKPRNTLAYSDYGLEVGTMFPLKSLVSVQGQNIHINPLNKGTVILFTSINCDVCKQIYPLLSKLNRKYQDISIVTMMLSEDKQMIASLIEQYKIDTPVVQVSSVEDLDAYATRRFPFAYVLSDAGHVVFKGVVNIEEHFDALIYKIKELKVAV